MIAAIDIFDEVKADVTALNGEIVRRALHGRCCDFVNHQDEFKSLLSYYTALRRRVHHLQILQNKPYLAGPRRHLDLKFSDSALWAEMAMARDARRRLKNIWPCTACICIFNPTNRTRLPCLI